MSIEYLERDFKDIEFALRAIKKRRDPYMFDHIVQVLGDLDVAFRVLEARLKDEHVMPGWAHACHGAAALIWNGERLLWNDHLIVMEASRCKLAALEAVHDLLVRLLAPPTPTRAS